MSKLPLLSGVELCKVLVKLGFQEIRQKGSYKYFRHPDGRATVVPMHSNRDIGRGLLRKILKEIELSREDFLKNL